MSHHYVVGWSEGGQKSGICPGDALIIFVLSRGGAQHPLGTENPLKSID